MTYLSIFVICSKVFLWVCTHLIVYLILDKAARKSPDFVVFSEVWTPRHMLSLGKGTLSNMASNIKWI